MKYEGKVECCDCGEIYQLYRCNMNHISPDDCIRYLAKKIAELEEKITKINKSQKDSSMEGIPHGVEPGEMPTIYRKSKTIVNDPDADYDGVSSNIPIYLDTGKSYDGQL